MFDYNLLNTEIKPVVGIIIFSFKQIKREYEISSYSCVLFPKVAPKVRKSQIWRGDNFDRHPGKDLMFLSLIDCRLVPDIRKSEYFFVQRHDIKDGFSFNPPAGRRSSAGVFTEVDFLKFFRKRIVLRVRSCLLYTSPSPRD